MPDVTFASLRGAHILITGAGSGIGMACALALHQQGALVSTSDLTPAALEDYRAEDSLSVDVVDVTEAAAVADWVARRTAAFGPVSGLVCSAGIESARDDAVHSVSAEVWDATMAVNLRGTYTAVAPVVRGMLATNQPGSIVLIGSPTGFYGTELRRHAYSASKGGVLGLARVMANEYAGRGIRVNTIWPGFIATPLNEETMSDPARMESELAAIPMRRTGTPEEVAAMALFLLSDQAGYCTGGIYPVDGGFTAV